MGHSPVDVVLVGRERPADENLALRYLAAALVEAGHRPQLVPLCGPEDMLPAVATAIASGAPLVGVSIPDADAAIDALAFVRALREAGYSGHVTAGGALATLVRGEILARHPGVDSVVRHDGEIPIVALADGVGGGADLGGVAGLTTRAGDGAPAAVLDPAPLRLRPLRPDRLPRILGVPMARMLASRGCPGRCPYCGPAALQRGAVEEGLRGGADRARLARLGVGGLRRRDPEDVADEAAGLYHRRGARFFHLLDDNLLAGGPRASTEWLRALVRALAARRVHRTAWSLQADPAQLSPRAIDALEELGVVRMLLGVEAVTPAGLRALGRPGDPARSLEIAHELARRGVVTLFNDILVHPDASAGSIEAELEGLARVHDVHFDALAMAVYPGTDAWRRLCERGEATGGMLGWRFQPRDPVVARFRAALVRLRLQAVGRYGVNVFAHDVAVNVALARRLELTTHHAALAADLRTAVKSINRARLDAWRAALAVSARELSGAERAAAVGDLVRSLALRLAPLHARIERIEGRLERLAAAARGAANLLVRSALAAGFSLLWAPAAACGARAHGDDDTAAERDAGRDAALDAGRDASAPPDAAADAALDASADAGCTPEREMTEYQEARSRPNEAGCATCTGDGTVAYGIAIDASGRIVDVRREDGGAVDPAVRDCYLAALAGETFPCLAGDEVWQECVICLF